MRGEFGWVGFLAVCFLFTINSNPRKIVFRGEADQNATLNLIVLGLGSPWVEKFVDFMIIFIDFSTQHHLVNGKRPIVHVKKAMVEESRRSETFQLKRAGVYFHLESHHSILSVHIRSSWCISPYPASHSSSHSVLRQTNVFIFPPFPTSCEHEAADKTTFTGYGSFIGTCVGVAE